MTGPETTRPNDDLRVQPSGEGTTGAVSVSGTESSVNGGGEPSGGNEGELSFGGGRLSREDLEKRYRDNPRFTMLFENGPVTAKPKSAPKHVDKNGNPIPPRRYIRVAGIRLTPKRILILAGFLLIMLGCVGACFFFLVKDIDRSVECAKAIALYESGDFATAKDKLIAVVNRDPHKESALAALADIYHHYGDWGNETFFRQRLARLNPMKKEYFDAYLDSAMRARNFNTIYSLLNLQVLDNADMDPETGALFLISALHSDHIANGKSFYHSMLGHDPEFFSKTERGRFAEVLLKAERMDPLEAELLFAGLDDVKDPSVRFEILNMRAYLLSKIPSGEYDDKIDAMLKEAAELNNFAGAPILANRHFVKGRFQEAMDICTEYLKTRVNTIMPIIYGESCVLSGQPELVAEMKNRIRPLGGRQSLIIASYLEALEAFSDGDLTKAKACLQASGGSIETPLSALMQLFIAIQNRSSTEIRFILNRIMIRPPFMDFQQRARSAALQYLLSEVGGDARPDPRQITEYAAIAELIQLPSDDNSFLQRIILLDRYKRNILNEDDLEATLAKFPGDPVLLQIAAEYYLLRHQPQRTMQYIERASGTDRGDMAVLHMLALDQLSRVDEAEAEFRSIVERDPDNGDLLYYYYAYCSDHGILDSMRELAKRIEGLPADSVLREFLPFVRAEIMYADGRKDEALDVFEKTRTSRPDLIARAGDFLAAGGRPDAAIKRYLSITTNAPDKVQLHLKLSKLYRDKNDLKSAMAHAKSAWQEDRDDREARFVYGGYLFDDKQYAEAVNVLKFPQYRAPLPDDMVELWGKAMREQIAADFTAGRLTPAMEGAKHLLIYFPNDEKAKAIIQQIETIRQNEKKRTSSRNDSNSDL